MKFLSQETKKILTDLAHDPELFKAEGVKTLYQLNDLLCNALQVQNYYIGLDRDIADYFTQEAQKTIKKTIK